MATAAQIKASKKYINEHYSAFTIRIPNEQAEKLRKAAAANGDSVRSVLKTAIDQYLEKHGEIDN